MGNTVLIAGKNMPDASSFCEGFAMAQRKIVVSGDQSDIDYKEKRLTIAQRKANQEAYEEEMNREAETGICTVEWNKSSPLSARSLVLQAETIFGKFDEAVLYFDEDWFASRADKMNLEEISRGADDMVVSYQYLALEILSYFNKRDSSFGPGTLVFVIKQGACPFEILKDPALKTGLSAVSSPLVAAAASAFVSFAENIAAVYNESNYVNVVLIRGDADTIFFRRDDETGKWICEYLDTEYQQDREYSGKTVKWIKPGLPEPVPQPVVHKSGGFRFFKR